MRPIKRPKEKIDWKIGIKNITYLLKDYKLKLTLTVISAFISTLFTILGPLYIGQATTIIYNGLNLLIQHKGTINFTLLTNTLLIAAILYIISSIFNYLQRWFLTEISTGISYNLRKQLIEKVNQLPLKELGENKRGDILSRITNDIDSLQTGINSSLIQLITSILSIIGVFVMMLLINIEMTILTLILIPISFIIIQIITKHSQKYFIKQLEYKGDVNSQIEETITGQDIIRTFNQEEESYEKFKKDNNNLYTQEWKSQFYSSLAGPITNFISNLSYVIIAVLGGIFVIEKAITVGDILAFFQYIKNFTEPIQQITRVMNLLQISMAASVRIFEFLDLENEKETGKEKFENLNEKINFENVGFSYEQNPVIENLNMEIKKGEKLAIVGHTGAGKSTIINLLMRFYDPQKGEIKIDNTNINKYTKNSLRSKIGMVLQDTWLFNDTILENIRYGNLNATDKEVKEALKAVQADKFIEKLPEGYNTIINEDSSNISQGQKQLLTIARCILSNNQILILDEATSSVDTRLEKQIQDAMDKLMKNKTSIIIAHRLSTIKNADKIVVLDKGKIQEEGTHQELINKNGYYKKLYTNTI